MVDQDVQAGAPAHARDDASHNYDDTATSSAPVSQPVLPAMPEAAEMNAYDEAQLQSEQARLLFQKDEAYAGWLEDYFALVAEGWSWRQAVYMIWASLPREARSPATEQALATEVLGLTSARAIRNWKADNPHMELRIRKVQLSALGKDRAEVLAALRESAKTPSYRNYRDRELFFKMTGDLIERTRVDVGVVSPDADLTGMSAEELAAMAQIPVDNVGSDGS